MLLSTVGLNVTNRSMKSPFLVREVARSRVSDRIKLNTSHFQPLKKIQLSKAIPQVATQAQQQRGYEACNAQKMLENMKKPSMEQQKVLKTAASIALSKLASCVEGLEKGDKKYLDRLKYLFPSTVSVESIIAGFKLVQKDLERVDTTNSYRVDSTIDQCPAFAFTLVQPPNMPQRPLGIFIRGLFFKLHPEIQAHTLIHETLHLSLRSDDILLDDGTPAYTVQQSRKLLQEQPNEAIHNADSWASLTF